MPDQREFKKDGDYTSPGKLDSEETMICKFCGDMYRSKYDRCDKCLDAQHESMQSYFRKG